MFFGNKELIFDKPLVMGIINITTDSFSDGGKFISNNLTSEFDLRKIIKEIDFLEKSGASFIDIGAESTRPGYSPISTQEELDRLIPVLELISETKSIISIDTRKPEVMKEVLKFPIGLINDVSGLTSVLGRKIIKNHNVPICIMHNSRDRTKSLEDDIDSFFKTQINQLKAVGIKEQNIILDPGFGYDKTFEENKKLLFDFDYSQYKNKILIGLSRKGFLKKLFNEAKIEDIDEKSAIASIIAAENGANILRVHNVAKLSKKLKDQIDVC
mgnify:FL=1